MVLPREGDRVKPIIEYIKKNSAKGYKMQDLKWALINQGYSRIEVDKAIKQIQEIQDLQKPKKSEPEVKEAAPIMPIVEPEKKSFWKKIFG